MAALHAEIAHLRGQVQQLTSERNVLKGQPPFAGAAPLQGGPAAPASSASGGDAPAGPQQRAGQPDGRVSYMSAAGATVDPGALVDKLRSLVNGLVAEALAAQQQRPPGQPPTPGSPFPQQQHPFSYPERPSYANGQGAKLHPPQHLAAMGRMSMRPAWGDAAQPPTPPPMAAATAAPADSQAAGMRVGWPGVMMHIVPTPPMPLGAYPLPVAAADGKTPAGPSPAAMPSASAAAPAVLELNVDGTTVFVERAVLESQAAGSRLHQTLVTEYGKLPLDSKGRPYLSYDPRVFQVLMSHLKERHLFGSAAATAAGPLRDWSRTAESLGVSPRYFAQAASHFGLADTVPPPPPQQQQRQQPEQGVAASTASHAAQIAPVASAGPIAAAGSITAAPSVTSVASIGAAASVASKASVDPIPVAPIAAAGSITAAPSVASVASIGAAASIASKASVDPIPVAPIAAAGSITAAPSVASVASIGAAASIASKASVDPIPVAISAPINTATSAAPAAHITASFPAFPAVSVPPPISITSVTLDAAITPATYADPIITAPSSASVVATAASAGPIAFAASIAAAPSAGPIAAAPSAGPIAAAPSAGTIAATASAAPVLSAAPSAAASGDYLAYHTSQPSLTAAPQSLTQQPSASAGISPHTSQQVPTTEAAQGNLLGDLLGVPSGPAPEIEQAPSAAAAAEAASPAVSTGAPEGQPWGQLPSLRVPLQPRDSRGSVSSGGARSSTGSMRQLASAAVEGSLSREVPSITSQGSMPAPSRIPPPPPSQKPAAAPNADAAAFAPAASVGGLAPSASSKDSSSAVPEGWQPFSDEPAQGATSFSAASPAASLTAAVSGQASAAAAESGGSVLGGEAALPSLNSVASAAMAAAAAAAAAQPPAEPAPAGGSLAMTASLGGASFDARAAADAEQYRVGNMYTILSEKRRAELEADDGASA